MIAYFAIKRIKSLNIKQKFDQINPAYISLVWESAWKNCMTAIISKSIFHISSILAVQWFSPTQSASFQFTKRLFDVIETFTMTTFYARIPSIAKLRGRGNFSVLIPLVKQTQWMAYLVFLTGYSVLLFLGKDALILINSEIELGSSTLIILFSLSTFFSRWTGMALALSNQSNHIIEHICILFVGIVFFIMIYLFNDALGVNVFPFAMLFALLCSIPFVVKQVYPVIGTSFFLFESKCMLPALCALILIDSIYYIFTNYL